MSSSITVVNANTSSTSTLTGYVISYNNGEYYKLINGADINKISYNAINSSLSKLIDSRIIDSRMTTSTIFNTNGTIIEPGKWNNIPIIYSGATTSTPSKVMFPLHGEDNNNNLIVLDSTNYMGNRWLNSYVSNIANAASYPGSVYIMDFDKSSYLITGQNTIVVDVATTRNNQATNLFTFVSTSKKTDADIVDIYNNISSYYSSRSINDLSFGFPPRGLKVTDSIDGSTRSTIYDFTGDIKNNVLNITDMNGLDVYIIDNIDSKGVVKYKHIYNSTNSTQFGPVLVTPPEKKYVLFVMYSSKNLFTP